MRRYITHVFNEGLPPQGLRKLSYITITDDETGVEEYFLGTDNNPMDESEFMMMINEGSLIPLPEPVELEEGKSLFVDNNGDLYLANRLDSDSGRNKLKAVVREFSRLAGKLKAEKYIPKELPEVKLYYEYE